MSSLVRVQVPPSTFFQQKQKTLIDKSSNKLAKLLKKLGNKPSKNHFLVENSRNISCFLNSLNSLNSLKTRQKKFKLKYLVSSTEENLSKFQREQRELGKEFLFKEEVFKVFEKSLYEKLNSMDSPADLLAVFERNESEYKSTLLSKNFLEEDFLILDQIQDPGNLGTIFRTALASGWKKVICLKGTTEAFAPKVIRASTGLLAYLEIYSQISFRELKDFLLDLQFSLKAGQSKQSKELKIYNSSLKNSNNLSPAPFNDKSLKALIIGNEGQGSSNDWDFQESPTNTETKELEIIKIKIPMLEPKVGALNASTAAALLMYKLHNLI